MTNTTRSRLPIWGTIAHGFATPTGPATSAPPQRHWSSVETSRKLTFTPVRKFSASPSSRNRWPPRRARPSGAEVEMHEPDHRQHQHCERHVGPAQRVGVVGADSSHHRQLEGTEGSGRDRQGEEQQVGVVRPLLEPDEEVDDAERQARRGHCDPGDFDPAHVGANMKAAVAEPVPRVSTSLEWTRVSSRRSTDTALLRPKTPAAASSSGASSAITNWCSPS